MGIGGNVGLGRVGLPWCSGPGYAVGGAHWLGEECPSSSDEHDRVGFPLWSPSQWREFQERS